MTLNLPYLNPSYGIFIVLDRRSIAVGEAH
jgi:hypothetical protein